MRFLFLTSIWFAYVSPVLTQSRPMQKKAGNFVVWQANQPLSWENFKGVPDKDDWVHGAVTYAGFDVQVEEVHFFSREVLFKVVAVFDQRQSWVKPEKKDSGLLAHEQLHFDIAELFARKLEKKLNSLKVSVHDKAVVKKWQDYFTKAQLSLQNKYDHETVHGIRKEQQLAWQQEISRQLNKKGPNPSVQGYRLVKNK